MEILTEIVETIQNISDDNNDELKFMDENIFVDSRTQSRAHLSQGVKYFEEGNFKKARIEFLKSIEFDANSIDANFNIGVLFRDEQNYNQALKYFTNCNQLKAQNFTVLFNIAFCNEMLKQYNIAICFYEQAAKTSKDNSLLYFNLGNIYKQLKDWQNAKLNYDKALAIEPNNTSYLINSAVVFFFTGAFNNVISIYNKVLKLEPDNISAKINYAAALVEVEKFEEALGIYNSLLKTDYEDIELHYNLAVLLLLLGNYKQGLKEYEWRLNNENKYNHYHEIPYWDNEKLTGKRIIVIDEQGIGDAFQFVRYFKILKETGAEVIYSCRQSLVGFMESAQVADSVIPLGTAIKADYKIYIMSLPLKYLSVSNTSKFEFPYLNFDKKTNKNYIIDVDKQKLNIGVVWRGNQDHKYDFKRSVKPNDFFKMLSIKDIKVFSLQIDISEKEKKVLDSNHIIDLNSKLETFTETAKIISQLDLIISVDTAVVHLAGALNKKTFLLLSKVPDWRWGLDTNTTQSYPSVKLFRQNKLSDWTNVFAEIKKAINEIILSNTDKEQNDSASILKLKLKALEAIESKNYAQAVEKLEAFLMIKQNDDEALFWLGFCYFELKNYIKAEQILLKAEKVNNHNYEILSLLGKLSLRKNSFVQAKNYYKKALSINEDIDTLSGLGVALQKQGKFGESLNYFKRAISLDENIAGSHLNYANSFYYLQNFEEAIKHFDISIKLENLTSAHIGKSFALLAQKKFGAGFKEYSWSLTNFKLPKKSEAVKWSGQHAEGKNIFIYAEQGLGDTIQFSRFFLKVKNKGLNITLCCLEPLKKLFEINPLLNRISDKITADINYYASIMELPKILELENEDNFTLAEGLFNVDDNLVQKWKLKLSDEKFNVGLVWETKSKSGTTESRSASLNVIEPLLAVDNVNFYVLQKDYDEATIEILDKYSNVKLISEDVLNMAALIENLDLVITIDSMIANLAGTLNKETWIMLPLVSDWRWEYAGGKSYWYPSVKLFRQTEFNNWSSVIENVKKELGEKVEIFNNESTPKSQNLINPTFQRGDCVPKTYFPERTFPKGSVIVREGTFRSGLNNQKEKTENKIVQIKKLLDEHNFETAKSELLNLVNQNSQSVEANFYLGYIFQLENKLETAASYYSKVLSIYPAHFDALNNLGVVLKDLGRFKEAEEFLNYASVINEKNPSVYNNLGIVYDLRGEFNNAIKIFQKAIEINPKYQDALLNYANILQTVKKYSEAITVLKKLLSINPNHIGGNFNKALTLLAMGDYKKGFELYEWRRQRKDFFVRNFNRPELTNQNVNGKIILVYDEQGLGDTIQFYRYVKLLSEKNAKVILQCHSALFDLLKGCDGLDTVIARETLDDPGIQYDYHIPLLSLPRYFGTGINTIPTKIPYINVSETMVKDFYERYFNNQKINIGIVWEGKTPIGNSHRACPLDFFISLIGDEKFKFFSLQKGKAVIRDKQKMGMYGIVDLSCELKTFNETAAIIKSLDLVITIDTSVSHLSGALGAKTYTLLSYKSDWRWLNGDDYSVWYPMMRLIKQSEYGNWDNVFKKIKSLLKNNEMDFAK